MIPWPGALPATPYVQRGFCPVEILVGIIPLFRVFSSPWVRCELGEGYEIWNDRRKYYSRYSSDRHYYSHPWFTWSIPSSFATGARHLRHHPAVVTRRINVGTDYPSSGPIRMVVQETDASAAEERIDHVIQGDANSSAFQKCSESSISDGDSRSRVPHLACNVPRQASYRRHRLCKQGFVLQRRF